MKLHKFQDQDAPDCYAFVLANDEKQAIELLVKKLGVERVNRCKYLRSAPLDQLRPCVLRCDIIPF